MIGVFLYIAINTYILYIYYKKEGGIYMLPFMMAITSFMVILPQYVTIETHNLVDSRLEFLFPFILISSNIAFACGFNKGNKFSYTPSILDLRINYLKAIIVLFTIIGSIYSYKNMGYMNIGEASDRSGFLINNMLSTYLLYAAVMAILLFVRWRIKQAYVIAPIILFLFFQLVTVFVGARRSYVIGIVFLYSFIFYNLYPKWRKQIKQGITIFFIFGGVISASISSIRISLSEKGQIENTDYTQMFLKSFSQDINEDVGMDLFNCANGIKYVKETNGFSLGADIWNGFVDVFVPRFIVGQAKKDSLKIPTTYGKMVPLWTHDITTMTGYFYGYAAFSLFGFLIFYLLGYLGGKLYILGSDSLFYGFIYLLLLVKIHSLFSHGIQYYLSVLENVCILFVPFVFLIIYKKKEVI